MRIPVLFLSLSLVLSACTRPTPLPSGYTYHGDEYKSPPAADSNEIGYDYSAKANAQVVKIWTGIARALVDSLEQSRDLPNDGLYLKTPYLQSAQLLSLDYALRQELNARGYNFAQGPGSSALNLEVRVKPVPDDAAGIKTAPALPAISAYKGNPKDFQKRLVTINAAKNGMPAFTHHEIYTLPDFGYVPDHGGFRGTEWNRALGKAPVFVPEPLKPESYNN